ncbi:MAG: amidohydrolase [Alphaproteobacteria bacterium]|jgi:hypothetical protein|nr:amidohydrolase [Alphaproteobacteria bacterium]MDP6565197.1 amidohydrolase [Alphaproteobacteria bacterium]MDP6811988.1 amidohydrolase [Alphaproteobacteria bacterium]
MDRADLILQGGRIFVGPDWGFAEALAIADDRIIAVGADSDLEGLAGPDSRVVDLQGRAAVPGFNDAHQHMLSLGLSLLEVDLRADEVRALDELLRRIRQRAETIGPGQWVVGGRYDHFQLDVGRHPTRQELDAAAPGNPVFIVRACGHVAVANSLALRAAGIDETTPDPAGGQIIRRDGRLTGELREGARDPVKWVIPPQPPAALVEALEQAGKLYHRYGITSIMDAGVGLRQKMDDLDAFRDAHRQGRLPVRCYLSILGGSDGIQDTAGTAGLTTGSGDEYLKIGSVKLFADGSAGGRTAAMTEPYLNGGDGEEKGLLILSDDEMDHWVARYHGQGNQVSIHAIGDAAIEQSLNAIERAMAGDDGAGHDRRHRIEHCSFTTPAQIERMRRLGVLPAPQPVFIREFGDLYVDVLGHARPAASYPMRSWVEAGLSPASGSDAPVSDFDPMKNLHAMLTRETDRGIVLGPNQTIDLAEAVTTLTQNGAYASFSERVKGTLEPGMLADVAVLDSDIFDTPVEHLPACQCDMTILAGAVVYDRLGLAGAAD